MCFLIRWMITEFEDTFEPNNFDFYANPSSQWNKEKQNTLDQQWYNRTTELVDKYDPDFMLFDWHVVGDDYTKDFLTHYYNHAEKTNPDGVIMTIKLKALDGGYVRGVERGRAAEIRDLRGKAIHLSAGNLGDILKMKNTNPHWNW